MFNIQYGIKSYNWSLIEVQNKLEKIASIDKKASWIRFDLSSQHSSFFSRFIWTFIAKHCNCLRERLFHINLNQSQDMLLQIGQQIDKKNVECIKIYNLAAQNFNLIANRHQVPILELPLEEVPPIKEATPAEKIMSLFNHIHKEEPNRQCEIVNQAIKLSETDAQVSKFLDIFLQRLTTPQIKVLFSAFVNLPVDKQVLLFKETDFKHVSELTEGVDESHAAIFRNVIISGDSEGHARYSILRAFFSDLAQFQVLCNSFKSLKETDRHSGMQILIKEMQEGDYRPFAIEKHIQLLNVLFDLDNEDDLNDAIKLSKNEDKEFVPLRILVSIYRIKQILKNADTINAPNEVYSELRKWEDLLDKGNLVTVLITQSPESIPLFLKAITYYESWKSRVFITAFLETNDQQAIHLFFQNFWPMESCFLGYNYDRLSGILNHIDTKMKFEEALNTLPDDLSLSQRTFFIRSLCSRYPEIYLGKKIYNQVPLSQEEILSIIKQQTGKNKEAIDVVFGDAVKK
jgi:hypothetical protein